MQYFILNMLQTSKCNVQQESMEEYKYVGNGPIPENFPGATWAEI
jgi:hypothetical protein